MLPDVVLLRQMMPGGSVPFDKERADALTYAILDRERHLLEHIIELHRIGDQLREQFDKFIKCEERAKQMEAEARNTPLVFDFKSKE
jgi:hypothetical protein